MCRLRSRVSSVPSILASGLLSVFLAAAVGCGGDDDGDDADDADDADDDGDDGPDAAVADAAVEMTRSGLIAVTETTVTNELALGLGPAPGISGAVVSMGYIDEQTITTLPLEGFENNVGGCLITVYDVKAGDVEPDSVDEGGFTVSGTANGDFACAFNDAAGGYVCQSTDADLGGGVAGNAIDGELDVNGTFTLVGGNFGPEMAGMYLQLDGFDGDGDGVYPVVNVPDAETLVLSPLVVVPALSIGGKTATYTTFVGEGPMFDVAPVEFLDDGISKDAQDVIITKEDSDLVPGFTVTALARGEGLVLSKDSNLPHEFPAKPADVLFGCLDEGCGSDPDQATGQLDAMVINGVTTDVLPAKGDDGLTMLPAVSSYAVFSCSAIGVDSVEIPLEGVQAILDTNPARVQITVGRFVAALPTDTTVVLGHSLTGFTTFKALP